MRISTGFDGFNGAAAAQPRKSFPAAIYTVRVRCGRGRVRGSRVLRGRDLRHLSGGLRRVPGVHLRFSANLRERTLCRQLRQRRSVLRSQHVYVALRFPGFMSDAGPGLRSPGRQRSYDGCVRVVHMPMRT
jgi:hypothetical protein